MLNNKESCDVKVTAFFVVTTVFLSLIGDIPLVTIFEKTYLILIIPFRYSV